MPPSTELGTQIYKEFIVGTNPDGTPIFKPEKYGSAEITAAEFGALRNLYKTIRSQVYEDGKTLNEEENKNLRELVTESIINDGWPAFKSLNTSSLTQAAVSHACMVVESLYQKRGEAALHDLVWSYTTKNQFDRYVEKTLRKNGKLENGGTLADQWASTTKRVELIKGDIDYPEVVDDKFIYGVGKVERYWPAQLMRYLESIRLGKSGKDELTKYKVGDTDRGKFKIPWSTFDEVITKAESVEDITVGIALKTLEILKSRDINKDQLVAIIANGYSPSGAISEHGKIEGIESVWNKLLQKIESNSGLKDLYEQLKAEYQNRIK